MCLSSNSYNVALLWAGISVLDLVDMAAISDKEIGLACYETVDELVVKNTLVSNTTRSLLIEPTIKILLCNLPFFNCLAYLIYQLIGKVLC